jgi:predicted kinase
LPGLPTAKDGAVRTDQPRVADGQADVTSLPERSGDRDELRQRLQRLPPGHPSSPVDADGTPRPPEPGLRCRDSPDAQPLRETDRQPLTDAEHAEHVKEVRVLLDKARADGLATDQQHTIDPDNELWTEDRVFMQDAIITDLYTAAAEVPCDRQAILAGGLPGAGKTTVLEQHASIDRSRFLTINPDQIKEEMAKRGMIPEVAGLTPMEASDLVHEESSYVAKQLALRATADGKNVIWDITMSSRVSTESRIGDLRAAGYSRVEGVFVDIPIEVAIRRSDARHREGHDDYSVGHGLGGRFVPAEVIAAQADPDWGSRNRKTFEQVKPQLDAWLQCDNSVDGRSPVLVDSGSRDEDER